MLRRNFEIGQNREQRQCDSFHRSPRISLARRGPQQRHCRQLCPAQHDGSSPTPSAVQPTPHIPPTNSPHTHQKASSSSTGGADTTPQHGLSSHLPPSRLRLQWSFMDPQEAPGEAPQRQGTCHTVSGHLASRGASVGWGSSHGRQPGQEVQRMLVVVTMQREQTREARRREVTMRVP